MTNPNKDQIDFWNGEGGRRWTEQNQTIDALIRPIGEATLDAAAARAGEHAIDVGCGCGNQTLALARRIGPGGSVLGVDVSEPMLALAREQTAADASPRAAIEFRCADASAHAFAPGATDLLFSRFGVMFFAEPTVAFANLHRALHDGGRLAFCCWRSMKENELMRLPLEVVLRYLPPAAAVPPETPGPFAFADRARVLRILAEAGFKEAAVEALDIELHFGAGVGAAETARRLLDLGPASRMLADAPAELRQRVAGDLAAAIASRCTGRGFSLTACCWQVSAGA